MQVQENKNTLLQRAFQYLDTPITDIARREKAQNETKTSTINHTAHPHQDLNITFRPLVDPEKISSQLKKPLEIEVIDRDDTTIVDCFKTSMGIAWKTGRVASLISLGTSIASSVLPYVTTYSGARLTDALISISKRPEAASEANLWFLSTVACSLGLFCASAAKRYVSTFHESKKRLAIAKEVRESLAAFPPSEQVSPEISKLMNVTMGSMYSVQNFGSNLMEFVVPIGSIVTAVGMVAPYSPLGASLLTLFTVPYLYHSHKSGEDRLKTCHALSEAESRLSSRKWGLLTGAEQVNFRIYGKTDELLGHVDQQDNALENFRLQPELNDQKRDGWVSPLNSISIAAVGYVVLQDVINTQALGIAGPSVGDFGLVTGALWSLNSAINQFSLNIGSMLRSLPEARLAISVLKEGKKYKNFANIGVPIDSEIASEIKVQNVRFSYPCTSKEKAVETLKGLSFNVQPGEYLAIVGESGGGKTSLVNLFAGIYPPDSGNIAINGIDISEIQKSSLWAAAGYYRQMSGNFYSMTLRENILIGARRPISDQEILKLCEETGFLKAMKKNKLTLDTILGQWYENGTELSGGEHCRLALTRQMATGAKFMILDEPTNGLDPAMAEKVAKLIENRKGVTRIVIVHDLAMAMAADRILVLENGVVESIGRPDELINKSKTLSRAIRRQSSKLKIKDGVI